MLVVDIPKGALLQDSRYIGHLKKYDRIVAIRDRPDRCQKSVCLPDVLERHLAAEEIGRAFARLLREKFAHEPHILLRILPGGDKTRVIADAAIASKLADEAQKLAFAATDLEHGLPANVVGVDELLGDGAVEGVERR